MFRIKLAQLKDLGLNQCLFYPIHGIKITPSLFLPLKRVLMGMCRTPTALKSLDCGANDLSHIEGHVYSVLIFT